MFEKIILPIDTNPFDKLSADIVFDNVTTGRKGAILVLKHPDDETVPIIRTTTKYNNPAHNFSEIHHEIIGHIQKLSVKKNVDFNNAMIEMYNTTYRNMGAHSDQALDMADNSFIGIYSCYRYPQT